MNSLSVEARVSRLERSARRWRMAALGLGGVAAGMLIAGMGRADTPAQPVEIVNWSDMVGQSGVFNPDGTLRTSEGGAAIATRSEGGTIDSVGAVEGEVTVTGRSIIGSPRPR